MSNNKTQEKSHVKSGSQLSMKLRLLLSSLILYVFALGFNTVFTLIALEKLYVETNVSEFRVIAKDIKRNVENGIYYGKTLKNFTGVEKLLADAKKTLLKKVTRKKKTTIDTEKKLQSEDIIISISTLDGTILHSDNSHLINTKLPESVLPEQTNVGTQNSRIKNSIFKKHNHLYFTTLLLKDRYDNNIGFVTVSFKEKQVKAILEKIIKENSLKVGLIFVGSILLLLILLTGMPMDSIRFSRKKISFVIFFIICSAQIFSSGYMTFIYKDHFIEINKDNSEALTAIVKRDITYLLNQGIRMDHLVKMDVYLGRIIESTPELNDITIYDRNHHPLYRATKTSVTDFQKSKNAYTQWMEATKPLSNTEYNTKEEIYIDNQLKNYISTNTSRTILFKKVLDIAMDSLTVLVISILFLVEMLILVFKYVEKQATQKNIEEIPQGINYGVMRPAVFLLLFGVDISISFIPLHMQKLYIPLLNFSKETIIGLPISIEFMFVGFAILVSGVWLDRRGWHEPFIGGLLLAISGFVYSCLAPDALHFIVSRAIVGLGYGLALMASQGFVITYSDGRTKAQGLAHLFAGIYAGSICGGAAGAMLAERIGFNLTFLFGAIILISVLVYALIFMRNAMVKPQSLAAPVEDITPRPSRAVSNVFQFLSNRIVLSLIFFSSLPGAIAAVGFINYFIPIHLYREGVSQSTIGQVLMIYGICLIYIGPYISKYVDASQDKKRFIFLGCILGSFSFLTFQLLDGLASAMTAILLLGLSSSFVLASQSVYALKLRVTQRLGAGKAIGIFRSTSRVGQMLGPIIFAWLFAATNTNMGITYFGIAYLLTAFIFILLTQRDSSKVITDDS
jgi:predicted MFS family arabinose efflux permease